MKNTFIALSLAASLFAGNAMAEVPASQSAGAFASESGSAKSNKGIATDSKKLKYSLLASDICGFDFSSQEKASAFAAQLGVDEVISSSSPYHLGLSGALESLGDASGLTAPSPKKLQTLLKNAGVKQIFFKNEAAAKKFKKAVDANNPCATNTPVCMAV